MPQTVLYAFTGTVLGGNAAPARCTTERRLNSDLSPLDPLSIVHNILVFPLHFPLFTCTYPISQTPTLNLGYNSFLLLLSTLLIVPSRFHNYLCPPFPGQFIELRIKSRPITCFSRCLPPSRFARLTDRTQQHQRPSAHAALATELLTRITTSVH